MAVSLADLILFVHNTHILYKVARFTNRINHYDNAANL